jgi:hypothetical protein
MVKCKGDDNGVPCNVEVPDQGSWLCDKHRKAQSQAKQTKSKPSADTAVKVTKVWTKAEVKKWHTKFTKQGKEYLVSGASGPHVHIYENGCAHVKVGDKAHHFLPKPNGDFKENVWQEGVADVKDRKPAGKTKALLYAMAWTLAEHGIVDDDVFGRVIGELFDASGNPYEVV